MLEIFAFAVSVVLVGVPSFWLLGSLYGLVHQPRIFFPPALAAKMTGCAVLGLVLFGIGGIVLATWLFTIEFSKRDDHSAFKGALVGALISTIGSGIMLWSAVALAWFLFS